MYKTIKGIVLKKTRFADSSAYITVITESGLEKFSAKGVFSPKSHNAPACALYTFSEFVLSCRGENATLSSATVLKPLIRQGVDFDALSLANYVSSLAHDVTFTEEDAPGVFKLLGTTLSTINRMSVPVGIIKAVFELKLMALLGFYPDLDTCSRCGKDFDRGYFLPREGVVLCSECEIFHSDVRKIPFPESLVLGVSQLLSMDNASSFGIRFKDKRTELDFIALAEEFSLEHLDSATAALTFYKKNIENLTD